MQIFYTFMNEYLVKNHIFMNECLAENYTFMNVMGALAGLGIPIKEALRGFCNKIVTRLKHVSFPQNRHPYPPPPTNGTPQALERAKRKWNCTQRHTLTLKCVNFVNFVNFL